MIKHLAMRHKTASSEMTAAAESLAQTFMATWNRQDGAAYGNAYWDDAELVDPTGRIWDGRDAIANMHVELWRGPASESYVESRVRRVRPLNSKLMVVDLNVVVTGFSLPGAALNAEGQIKARLKHVVEQRGDEWKIVASQNTLVAGPPPSS